MVNRLVVGTRGGFYGRFTVKRERETKEGGREEKSSVTRFTRPDTAERSSELRESGNETCVFRSGSRGRFR